MVDSVSGTVHCRATSEIPGRVFLNPNDPGEAVLLSALQPRGELAVGDVVGCIHGGSVGVSWGFVKDARVVCVLRGSVGLKLH